MSKSKNTVELNGRLFDAKRLGCNNFIPISYNDGETPEKDFIDFLAQKMAAEIGKMMLADGAIKVEVGPEFDEDTGELKGYIVAVRTTPILYSTKKI